MKCQQIQELLSAYYDGVLPNDSSSNVDEHFVGCSACSKELTGFRKLSEMVTVFNSPAPSEKIWSQIERQLDNETPLTEGIKQVRGSRFYTSRLFVLATTIIIAVGISWFSYPLWFAHGHHHHQFTEDFGIYLEEFRRDPDAAQQILLAKYKNHPVIPDQAIKRVGYLPAVAGGLPEEYTLVSTHVMKIPCCSCIQSICKRSDGSTLVIFEHGGESCSNQECCLTELDNQITATWKQGRRQITLIGVRDTFEVDQMVAWLDQNSPSKN